MCLLEHTMNEIAKWGNGQLQNPRTHKIVLPVLFTYGYAMALLGLALTFDW